MFSIDADKQIVYSDVRVPDAANFNSRSTLADLVALKGWGKEDVTAIWNNFAGTPEFNELKEQKCFKNRDYGVGRIWDVIQRLAVPIPSNGHVVPLVQPVLAVAAATEPVEEPEPAEPAIRPYCFLPES